MRTSRERPVSPQSNRRVVRWEGITLSPVNEYLQRKALITAVQQVSGEEGGYHALTSDQVPLEEGCYQHGPTGEW